MTTSPRYFAELDGLRAVASIAVVATHTAFAAGVYTHGTWGAATQRLEVGVAIFFVLSGFLLGLPHLERAQNGRPVESTRRYAVKRLARILPVYWVVVVVALVAVPANRGSGLGVWIGNLTLVEHFRAPFLPTGLSQMWSLSVEAAFYLVLPLLGAGLAWIARHSRNRVRSVRLTLLALGLLGVVWTTVARLPERGLSRLLVSDADNAEVLPDAATLYSGQVLSPALDEKCRPVLILRDEGGRDLGTLLADCTGASLVGSNNALFVLSDPDILTNAGLANGDNAALALSLVESFAGNAKVFVETDTARAPDPASAPSQTGGEDPRQRTLADLDRFFVYPFSTFWIGLVLVTGLALWRGSRRFGRPREDEEPAEASKRRTIDASRRILMLARADAALVDRHVKNRIEGLASGLFGAVRRQAGGDAAAITRFLSRRAPDLGERFAGAYAAVTEEHLTERSRLDALGAFEAVIQEIWHEFGRVAGPARQDRR